MSYPYSQPPPPASYSYAPPPPPAPAGRSPAFYVAIAAIALLGIGALGTCGVVGGLVVLGSSQEHDPGVLPGTQVPAKVRTALVTKKLLRDDETLLVYYDGSVKLDMSEVSFATRDRLVYAKGDVVASMQLAEITQITRKTEPVIGDTYDITADDARTMRIEIAALNNSDSFANALESAWRKHKSGATITRVE